MNSDNILKHPMNFSLKARHSWAVAIFGLFIATIAFCVFIFDWNWFKEPVEHALSRESGRVVRIAGNLKVNLLAWKPTATVEGLSVSNPWWAPLGNTAEIPRLGVKVRLLPLLFGRLDLLRLDLQNPHFVFLRDVRGRATWEFGKTAAENAAPPDWPPIREFIIRNGEIRLLDEKRRLRLVGTLSSRETTGGEHGSFQLDGQGTMNGKAFVVRIAGGPLLNIDRSKPYEFALRASEGSTTVNADGAVTHPFNLGKLAAAVTFAGPNLADLYYMTGLAFPGTAAYRLKAELRRDGARTFLTNLSGTVGRSDLRGTASADRTNGRPFVTANLSSRSLYFTDLGPLFGGRAPAAALHAAAIRARIPITAVRKEALRTTDNSRLLPDMPLATERIRQMDGNIIYRADRVVSADFPLRNLDLHLKLEGGVLTADPVSFTLSAGKLTGAVRIDARRSVPDIAVDARMQNVSLGQFVSAKSASLEGMMEARAKLHGSGDSVHKVAASAVGTVTLVVPRGLVRERFAELLGVDVDRAFLFAGRGDTNVRCAIADFQAREGTLYARDIVFDTDVVKVTGSGTINMNAETLKMEFSGAPKKFTLLRLRAPIDLSGPWAHPAVGLKLGAVAAQVGAGIALGVLATPIAAILPFVDPGLASNADCTTMLADARARGTPALSHLHKSAVR